MNPCVPTGPDGRPQTAASNAAPSPSNPGGSQAQSAAQQLPECRRIAQVHLHGHLFHRKPAAFQHQPRPVQAHRLDELLRRAPSLPATCTASAGTGGQWPAVDTAAVRGRCRLFPSAGPCDPLTPQAHGRPCGRTVRVQNALVSRPRYRSCAITLRSAAVVGEFLKKGLCRRAIDR